MSPHCTNLKLLVTHLMKIQSFVDTVLPENVPLRHKSVMVSVSYDMIYIFGTSFLRF